MIDYDRKLSNERETQVPSHRMSILELLENLILKKMLASVSCYFMYSIKYHNGSWQQTQINSHWHFNPLYTYGIFLLVLNN